MVDGLAPVGHRFLEPELDRSTTCGRLRDVGDRHETCFRDMREHRAHGTVGECMGHPHETGANQRHSEIFHAKSFQVNGWPSQLFQAHRFTPRGQASSLISPADRRCNSRGGVTAASWLRLCSPRNVLRDYGNEIACQFMAHLRLRRTRGLTSSAGAAGRLARPVGLAGLTTSTSLCNEYCAIIYLAHRVAS